MMDGCSQRPEHTSVVCRLLLTPTIPLQLISDQYNCLSGVAFITNASTSYCFHYPQCICTYCSIISGLHMLYHVTFQKYPPDPQPVRPAAVWQMIYEYLLPYPNIIKQLVPSGSRHNKPVIGGLNSPEGQ